MVYIIYGVCFFTVYAYSAIRKMGSWCIYTYPPLVGYLILLTPLKSIIQYLFEKYITNLVFSIGIQMNAYLHIITSSFDQSCINLSSDNIGYRYIQYIIYIIWNYKLNAERCPVVIDSKRKWKYLNKYFIFTIFIILEFYYLLYNR